MRALIKRSRRQGMTIFLSSHLLAEVEELCSRVAVIRSGRIVYEGCTRRAPRRRLPPLPAEDDRPATGPRDLPARSADP